MDNCILIDYLTFTSQIDSVDSIINLMGFKELDFIHSKGFYGYADRYYYDGIHIHFNGREDMGICVEMSGTGCRTFENVCNGSYEHIFNIINSERSDYNITRIDVAYDDFNGLLNIDTIINDIKACNYVSRFKSFFFEEGYSKNGSLGKTIYFGSKKSDIRFRLYDKFSERGGFSNNFIKENNIDVWNRFEIMLRKERANAFFDFLVAGNSLTDLYFGVINNYIRFVVPNVTDSNVSRWETSIYWNTFINSTVKIKLVQPLREITKNILEDYVKKSCSSSIVSYIHLFGFDNFIDMIEMRSKFHLGTRQQNLLKQFEIDISELSLSVR